MIDKNPFPSSANFAEPSNQENIFMANINGISWYEYDNHLNAPFILEAYPSLEESNHDFIKRIVFECLILKMCLRCERWYNDEVREFLANQQEKGRWK